MSMTADALIEKTSRAFDAFLAGDTSVMASELAEDVEWIFPGTSAPRDAARAMGVLS